MSSEPESADGVAVLAQTFCAMTEAVTRDTLIALASRAATRLAAADGICLVPVRQERCLYTADKDPRPMSLRWEGSSFQRLVSGINGRNPQLRDGSAEDVLLLPSGSLQHLGSVLWIPLMQSPEWSALCIVWSQQHRSDAAQSHALEALAAALGLALQVQLKEQELVRVGQRHKYLIAELQHRVRNILAFVRSIIRRTGETAESAEEFALHLEARISSLARTQGMLALTGTTGVELEELVRAETTATAIREEQLIISGPPIRLHAKGAETIAMALHELATNSLKFGALATPRGRIAVNWKMDWTASPPHLHLSWIETGVAIAALAPRRRGFGQELIERTLPYQLNAQTRFTFTPGGLNCVINLPLNERTTPPSAFGRQREREGGHGTGNNTR